MKKSPAKALLMMGAILVISIVVTVGVTHVQQARENTSPATQQVVINGYTISVAVADTPAERKEGLSHTSSLADGGGLLFLFPESGKHGIWMKDMQYPIDIIWINANYQVIDIARAVSPDTYPEVFTPHKPARFVLEVPAGTSERHDIQIGSDVIIR